MGFVELHTLIRKPFFRRSEVGIFAAVALLIKHSFCNLSKHASPVPAPNWRLFVPPFDRPVWLHKKQ